MDKSSQHIGFGIICSVTGLLAWQRSVVEKLVSEADIALKVVVAEESTPLDRNVSGGLGSIENEALFREATIVSCSFNITEDKRARLNDVAIQEIKKEGLDFLISFSAVPLFGNILDIARHGVWAFQFGDPSKYWGGIPGFWEIYNQDVVTSAYLLRLTEDSTALNLLHQGHLKTAISHKKNLDKMLRECISWPVKMCEDIRNNNLEITNINIRSKVQKIRSAPTLWQRLGLKLIQSKLLVKQLWRKLFFTDYWNIGVVHTPIQAFLNTEKKHVVKWFPDLSKTRFMADPFGLYHEGKLNIVYEDLKFGDGIGKTASLLYEESGYSQNEIVIDEEFHMSYPFLFKYKDEIFCIPETYQANEVRLYRASKFPSKWELEKVLIDNYAGIDNTLYKKDDIWFLFSTDKKSGPHHNLNIHFANDIFGPWKAHPKNPVKTDIRSARPAGTLFEDQGELFRPSMDYSEKIEGRITINKVLQLSAIDFREVAYTMVHPFENTPFSDKVHTLSKVGQYTLVDGAKELFVLSNFSAFKYKIKRVLNKVRHN